MTGRQRGAEGEALARRYYEEQGYTVLAANYATREGEVDIVAQRGETLVFCEVKARGPHAFAAPREWVDARKQQRIGKAARQYLAEECSAEYYVRFDVVEVLLQNGEATIECIEDAFVL